MGSKKLTFIIAAVIGVVVLTLGWVFVFGPAKPELVSPLPNKADNQAASGQTGTEKLIKYEDEAGFSFEYPEGLAVKDITPEDDITYSELEITSDTHAGKTLVRVQDAVKCTTIKCFMAGDTGSEARDITLAGMPGKQIKLNKPVLLQTVAIEDRVEYLVESPLAEPDSVFWNKVHNAIVYSFALDEATTAAGGANSQAGAAGGGEAIIEEEEVIE